MIKKFFLFLIKLYQIFISPYLGNNCRYYPTCSNYAREAIKEYKLLTAFKLIFLRVIKCNPWGGSGVDMLPDENAKNKN